MCWSAQRRCGPPLRSQLGCGPPRVGAVGRRTGRGRVRAARAPDDGAGARKAQNRNAQERTTMAEGPDGSATAPVLVVIPTYNERDNLEPLLARLHAAVPGADALVVDDGSPDGTGELADKLAANDPRVRVLHRTAKAGLGAAYLAGFAVALQGELPGRRRDGRRRQPRPRGPADAARRPRRAGRRRPGARLALRARRAGRELARLPQLDLPDREPLLAARAGRADPRHHRRVPRVPPRGAGGADAATRSSRRATASRSTWRGGRCRPGSASSRCRSRSPSGSAARRR